MKKKLTLSLIFFALGTMYASEAKKVAIYTLHQILPPSTNSREELEKENSIMEKLFGEEYHSNPNVKWKFGHSMTITPLSQKDDQNSLFSLNLFSLKMNTDKDDKGIIIESSKLLSMDGSQWEFNTTMLVKRIDGKTIQGCRIAIPQIVNGVPTKQQESKPIANQYKPKIFQEPQSSFFRKAIAQPIASVAFLAVLATVIIYNLDAIQMQFSHILHKLLPNFFTQG